MILCAACVAEPSADDDTWRFDLAGQTWHELIEAAVPVHTIKSPWNP